MTKSQKEEQRKKLVWLALFAMIAVMFGLMGLVAVDKSVIDLAMIAGTFFTSMAGIIGANLFSKPSQGADDK